MTDPETRVIPVDVVQADRDAAHKVRCIQLGHSVKLPNDGHYLIQAFARHRITALETLAAENARLRQAVVLANAALDRLTAASERFRATLSPVTQVKESGRAS